MSRTFTKAALEAIIYQVVKNSNQTKLLSKLSITLFIFVFAYFFYQGLTTTPIDIKESDSLAYHIPLAESFSEGNFTNFSHINRGLGYYPGIGEFILSFFIKLNIPLNLFNVLSFVLLFIVLEKLARIYNFDKDTSLIFAASVCLLPPVIREISTQMVDIWLAVFFICSLILLSKPKNSDTHYLLLGSSLGLLFGTKYVGIPLVFFLTLIYVKNILKYLSVKKFFLAFIPFFVFGLSWIVRNYFVTGNPFYPSALFSFEAHPAFTGMMWLSNVGVFLKPRNYKILFDAIASEMGIWSILFIISAASIFKTRTVHSKGFFQLLATGIFALSLFFPQPIQPTLQSTMSKFRFLIPGISVIILSIFIAAKKKKWLHSLCAFSFLNSLIFLPHLKYQPKLFFISLMISFIFIFKPKSIFQNLHKSA